MMIISGRSAIPELAHARRVGLREVDAGVGLAQADGARVRELWDRAAT